MICRNDHISLCVDVLAHGAGSQDRLGLTPVGGQRQAAGQQRRHLRGGAHLRGHHARDREHSPGRRGGNADHVGV